ncbi:MAG: hypothetical protein QXS21_05545 [Thermoproteota archaeon]
MTKMVLKPIPKEKVETKGGGKESRVLPKLKEIVKSGMIGEWFLVEDLYKECGITELPKHIWWMNRVMERDPELKQYRLIQGHEKDTKKMTFSIVKKEVRK